MDDQKSQSGNEQFDEFATSESSARLPGFGLPELLRSLRRRWWLLVIGPIVGFSAVWWMRKDDISTFTAEALIQVEIERSPMDDLQRQFLLQNAATQLTNSQLDIIASRAVLEPVVDALNMRVIINGEPGAAQDWLGDLQIAADAPSRAFLLSVSKSGIALVRPGSQDTIAGTSGPDELLSVAGVRFRMLHLPAFPTTLTLRVVSMQDAVRSLSSRLDVEPGQGNGLIWIRYTSRSPISAARVTNGVAASFQKRAAERARESASARRIFLEQQFAKWADSLVVAQQLLSDYQESSGILDPKVEGAAAVSALLASDRDLRRMRFQEGVLRSLIITLRANRPGNEAIQQVVALSADLVPGGAELYSRLRQHETERSSLTASQFGLTDTNQRVVVLDSLISAAREEIRAVTEQSLAVLTQKRQSTELEVESLRRQVGEVPAQLTSLGRFQRRAEGIQRTFDLIAGRYYQAQIDEAVGSGSVRIIDPAIVPAGANPGGNPRAPVVAIFIGLLLGVGLALGLEALDTTVRHAADVQRAAGASVIAVIPRIDFGRTNGARSTPFIATEHARGGAEAFRTLRTTLRFVRTQYPRVMAVTSPGPSEGKSLISANLAISLAQQGWRVLLVDADLRRPMQHTLFNVKRSPGLSDILVGDIDADAATQGHVETNLNLTVCGTATMAPAELLGSDAFREFLRWSRERYDAVVVDTPPALVCAEAIGLSPWLDGIMVAVRAGSTDRYALSGVVERLRQVGAPLLGIILNGVPSRSGASKYGGYYNYYGYEYSHTDYQETNGDSPGHANGRSILRWLLPWRQYPVPLPVAASTLLRRGPRTVHSDRTPPQA